MQVCLHPTAASSIITALEEISGPIYQEFLRSGMTDEELGDMLEEAKHAMRAEKHDETVR